MVYSINVVPTSKSPGSNEKSSYDEAWTGNVRFAIKDLDRLTFNLGDSVFKKPVKGGCMTGSGGADADRRRVAFTIDISWGGGEWGTREEDSGVVGAGGYRSIGATNGSVSEEGFDCRGSSLVA